MRIDHHIYFHGDPATDAKLDAVLSSLKGMKKTMSRLEDEVRETRDAVTALTGRYQAKIDEMQTQIDALKAAIANGDFEGATAAADALDQLQTDMAGLAQPAPPVEQPVPTGDDPQPADPGTGVDPAA